MNSPKTLSHRYRLRPTKDSKSTTVEGYTISPEWSPELANLLDFYYQRNKSSLPIVKSDKAVEISFIVAGTGPWKFGELKYVLSNGQTPVNSVYVPAYIPAAQANSSRGGLVTHKDLTVAIAFTIAETAVTTCKQQGYNVSANVVGRGGEVLVAMRGDNTGPHTYENSMKKAVTARAQGRPSGDFANAVKGNPGAGALRLTNMMPAQGALPIKVGDETIGAIGISGAPGGDKDEACAKAGIDKVANELK